MGNTAPNSGAPHNMDEALAMFLGTGFSCPRASLYLVMQVRVAVGVQARVYARVCVCGQERGRELRRAEATSPMGPWLQRMSGGRRMRGVGDAHLSCLY